MSTFKFTSKSNVSLYKDTLFKIKCSKSCCINTWWSFQSDVLAKVVEKEEKEVEEEEVEEVAVDYEENARLCICCSDEEFMSMATDPDYKTPYKYLLYLKTDPKCLNKKICKEEGDYNFRDSPKSYANDCIEASTYTKYGIHLTSEDYSLIEQERERIQNLIQYKKYATNIESHLPQHLHLSAYELDTIFYAGIKPENDEDMAIALKSVEEKNLAYEEERKNFISKV